MHKNLAAFVFVVLWIAIAAIRTLVYVGPQAPGCGGDPPIALQDAGTAPTGSSDPGEVPQPRCEPCQRIAVEECTCR